MNVQQNKLAKVLRMWYTFKMSNYVIHFDGSCWPNPGGVAAYGFTVDKDGVEIAAVAGVVPQLDGQTSNNVAEFYALYEALKVLVPMVIPGDKVIARGDSQIVVNIMCRMWRPNAVKLYYDAYRLANTIRDVLEDGGAELGYKWIPREENTRCDVLSKEHNNAPK